MTAMSHSSIIAIAIPLSLCLGRSSHDGTIIYFVSRRLTDSTVNSNPNSVPLESARSFAWPGRPGAQAFYLCAFLDLYF
uniref:Putative secreted protein n=1 Tax=Anopheles darlingi TaxID=43151 RepID=A0A2M4D5G5_ANODA